MAKKSPTKKRNYPANRKSAPPTSTSFGQLTNMQPGDNAKFTSVAVQIAMLPKIDRNDPKAVEDRIWEYFRIMIDNDMKPGVSGLANALGMDRHSFTAWVNGTRRAGQPQAALAKNAYNLLNQLWEDYMLAGKVNPVSGIFLGKNNFGYADKQEIDVNSKADAAREGKTDEELKSIYDSPIETTAETVE